MNNNFLISGIGGDIAQAICKILKSYFDDSIIVGTDITSQHAGTLFVDHFEEIEPATNINNYIKSILKIIEDNNISFFIPTSEQEIEVINKNTNLFNKIKLIFPGERVVDNCIDKFVTNEFLSSIGIATPWSCIEYRDIFLYPCIFKSRKGAGSKILFEVNDEQEAKYLSQKYNNGLFQELLRPKENEITCGVYRSHDGKTNSIQLKRRLSEGETSWAQTIYHNDIEQICHKIATKLNLIGSMNIQLIKTNSGPKIFEINPRFSSTVLMRHMIGFTDLIWSIKDSIGEPFEFTKIEEGIEMVRTKDSKFLK
tara:strand:- start:5222 stop:6154 length:933 start_codon:yes stop_codon:yes gene_type:complete